MSFKLNNSDNIESIGTFKFRHFPRVWEAKAAELVEEGCCKTMEEALQHCRNWEFVLELYYDKGSGVFAVECDAVETGTIYSPYTAELGEQADDYSPSV